MFSQNYVFPTYFPIYQIYYLAIINYTLIFEFKIFLQQHINDHEFMDLIHHKNILHLQQNEKSLIIPLELMIYHHMIKYLLSHYQFHLNNNINIIIKPKCNEHQY